MTTGTFFYDLSVSPAGWDFLPALMGAEIWRIRKGLDRLTVKVVPGPDQGFRRDALPEPLEARRRMLENVVLPLPALLPSCGEAARVISREPAPDHNELVNSIGWGEPRYGIDKSLDAATRSMQPLRAEDDLIEYCQGLYGAPRVGYVTITLRECSYHVSRNSNTAAWRQVARELRAQRIPVVVLRDAHQDNIALSDDWGDVRWFPCARRLRLRAALYAGAAMNLGVNNGPMWLPLFLGAPVLMFKMLDDFSPCTDPGFFECAGLPVGSNWPNARAGQRLVWEPDAAETILRVFDEVIGAVDGRPTNPIDRAEELGAGASSSKAAA